MHYSSSRLHLSIWLFCLFSSLTWAQTIQNLLWIVPDGNLSDLSQTFTAGDTLPLAWNALRTTDYVDTTKNLVDLWVTSFDMNLNPFNQSLTQNINLTSPGNYAWTIVIPDANLAVSAKYVLRFKAASSTYDPNSGELSSPGFIILRAAATTNPMSSSSTSSVTMSSTSTSSSLSNTPLSSTTNQHSTSGGLSSGAKAGIGIGSAIAALGLIGILYVFFIRGRRKNVTPTEPVSTQVDYKHGSITHPAELPAAWRATQHPTEMAAG